MRVKYSYLRLDYDYVVTDQDEDDNSNLESEIKLILRGKLQKATDQITQQILDSWLHTQPEPATSSCKDTPRKLEPDMRKEIERACNDGHERALQGIPVEIIRSVKGQRLKLAELQTNIPPELGPTRDTHFESVDSREPLICGKQSRFNHGPYDTYDSAQVHFSECINLNFLCNQGGHCFSPSLIDMNAQVINASVNDDPVARIHPMTDLPGLGNDLAYGWYARTE